MRILIVCNNMHIGGVQKALVDLLWSIHTRYEVTLLLFAAKGAYLSDIPNDVTVYQITSSYKYLGLTRDDVRSMRVEEIRRAFFAGITRIFGRKYAIKIMSLGQKTIYSYDIAISYLHNGGEKVFYGGCNDFVLRHVNAKKKITFLHCDYLLSGANTAENKEQYDLFDTIAACSEDCKKTFLSVNPSLMHKVTVVTNCHRYDVIKSKAEADPMIMDADKLNVVTVARLGKEKGVCRAIQAINMLGDAKSKLRYFIIGDGIERFEIERLIEDANLEDIVLMQGEKSNPYGYMQAANVLLIPSISEAAPLVIHEAASLGTPILSTRTLSVEEMIIRQNLGWICENSVQGIADGLKMLIESPALLSEKNHHIRSKSFGNEQAIAQFDEAITR